MNETPKIPKEIPNTSITSTGTDKTLYERTEGRKFVLEEILITNDSGGIAKIQLWDGASTEGRQKLNINVADTDGKTVHFNNLHREFEYGGVVAQTDSATVEISGSGHEE